MHFLNQFNQELTSSSKICFVLVAKWFQGPKMEGSSPTIGTVREKMQKNKVFTNNLTKKILALGMFSTDLKIILLMPRVVKI